MARPTSSGPDRKQSSSNLVWMDLEMTGLDARNDAATPPPPDARYGAAVARHHPPLAVVTLRSEAALTVTFALNRTCAPHLSLAEFIVLAQKAGVQAVEIRNDIEGQEFANGMPAAELKARLDDAGLKLASVNALQRFNDWTDARKMRRGR